MKCQLAGDKYVFCSPAYTKHEQRTKFVHDEKGVVTRQVGEQTPRLQRRLRLGRRRRRSPQSFSTPIHPSAMRPAEQPNRKRIGSSRIINHQSVGSILSSLLLRFNFLAPKKNESSVAAASFPETLPGGEPFFRGKNTTARIMILRP